jgi:hypothetical protein
MICIQAMHCRMACSLLADPPLSEQDEIQNTNDPFVKCGAVLLLLLMKEFGISGQSGI